MIALYRQAIKAWPHHEFATRQQIKALRRGYIRWVMHLGPDYLLHQSNNARRIK